MNMRYIEVVGGIGICRFDCELTDEELHRIGEFTTENVAKWLDICGGPGDFPIKDFHAVCDNIDIPWATKEGRDCYQVVQARAEQRMRERV
jgi:hypothetical protein